MADSETILAFEGELFEKLRQRAVQWGSRIHRAGQALAEADVARATASLALEQQYVRPLVLEDAWIAEVRAGMPELPREKRARFVKEYELSPYAAEVLTQHPRIAAFFEETVMLNGQAGRAVAVANFIQSEVLRDVTTHGLEAELPVSPRQVAELMKLVHAGTISGKQAKDVYARVAKDGTMPAAVVAELGLAQVSDAGAIEEACRRVILANPKQAESFKAGKTALLGYLVGQVMKETKGSANPALVNDTLKRLLAP